MLADLVKLKENLPISPIIDENTLADIALSNDLVNKLNSVLGDKGYRVGEYTSSFNQGGQYVMFPNQYFTLVGSLSDLAVELAKYISIFKKIRTDAEHLLGSESETQAYLRDHKDREDLFKTEEDIRLFSEFICKDRSEKRLGAKRLINDDGKPRSARDCFGSVILKCANLADVSSSIFGQLTYELTSERSVLEELQLMSNQLHYGALVVDRRIGKFVYKTLTFLITNHYEMPLFDHLVPKSEPHGSVNIEYENKRLTSIFKVSNVPLDDEALLRSNKPRWFSKPFEYDSTNLYLSTEWTVGKKSRLDLTSFANIFNHLYPDFEILTTGEIYKLLDKNSTSINAGSSNAKNEICYGAPGVGKSYSIDNAVDDSRTIRTVFHADTQYSDFVGCLKPHMDNSKPPRVIYSFRPGPFVNALIDATNNPSQDYWLVIEEINRAPAAAVFGDIFLLLDRNPASGASQLPVTVGDPDMLFYINSKTDNAFSDGKIKIPGNLSLLATMNSSDQAVMPLDTAFKRRWQFKYMPLDLSDGSPCAKGSLSIPSKSGQLQVEWRLFAEVVNKLLTEEHIPEDKHLGPFFLTSEELLEDNRRKALAGKLFVYLWDDVLRHGRQNVLFNSSIKTFGQLNDIFSQNQPIFNDEFYSLIEKQTSKDKNSLPVEDDL